MALTKYTRNSFKDGEVKTANINDGAVTNAKLSDDAVAAAHTAHLTLVAMPLEKRKEIIANIRKRCAEQVQLLAEIAVEETGLGRVEDKIKKNHF